VNASDFRNVWHESARVADARMRALQNETDIFCQLINRRNVTAQMFSNDTLNCNQDDL
jgi:hypothetical protein